MIEELFPFKAVQNRFYIGPLAPLIDGFAERLTSLGYANSTIKHKLRETLVLSRWLCRCNISLSLFDEQRVSQFNKYYRRRYKGRCRGTVTTLKLLLSYLRNLGETPFPASTIDDSPLKQIELEFERFLSLERGLSQATVTNYLPTVKQFLNERFESHEIQFSILYLPDVHRFILSQANQYSRSRIQLMVTALRSFFRFLYQYGYISTDLASEIPSVANWRCTELPKFLEPSQVEYLLASCNQHTTIGQRDYAILLLLARLGLRAGEVVALTLDDIDWDLGVLTVTGKGNRQAQLPLAEDVGTALANYLRHGRPHCTTRRVFIRLCAPHQGFSGSAAICNVVRRALKRAELSPDFKGSHLLRHSLATGMLRRGASLDEIGEVLRHCRPETTQIYAKVNLDALRTVAQPWPGGAL